MHSTTPGLGWVRRLYEALARTGYLRKWVLLGAAIGVVAGVGAVVFIHMVELASELFLGGLGSYHPPGPVGESAAEVSSKFGRPWAIPLVVSFGALLSGILVFKWAPEAEGHGTDAAIEAVHHNPKGIRAHVSLIKLLASALTLGSGGSGGREGPAAQISAGFGSFLARRLNLTPADARIAVAVGIGAGIGAIFRAPLGGAVMGAEILYLEDIESEALLPSFIASIVGFSVFGVVEGFTPIFGFVRGYRFTHPVELIYFALLGVAAGGIGRLYAFTFYRTIEIFHKVRLSRYFRPALGGLFVGLLGLAFPEALGTGYGHVQEAMTLEVLTIPLWVLLLLPFVKILATSLSIGSGASAGIFGPGMVIGGLLGAGLWRLLEGAPGMPDVPGPFVVVGMIAGFGSISHAYLAVMLMVAEMTGSLALLPPAMVTLGLAALIAGDRTIYRSQLRNRSESVAYRTKLGLPLMSTIAVEDAMSPPRLVLDDSFSVVEARDELMRTQLPGAPVIDRSGRFIGVAELPRLDRDEDGGIRSALDHEYPSVPTLSSLDSALDVLATGEIDWSPVVTGDGRVVGIIATSDLLRAYEEALASSHRKMSALLKNAAMIEAEIAPGAPAAGREVREVNFPPGTVILTILRGDQLIFPKSGTRLSAGDRLRFVARTENEARVKLLVHPGEDPPPPEEGAGLI